MLLLALLTLVAGPEAKSEAVELKTDTGTLYGTLDLPPTPGPWPAVLIHPGSGPTDRDGNSVLTHNDSLKQLGHALAGKGIACLRIDKRGIGKSAKALAKEEDASIDGYAADVVGWVKLLRADKRFTKVGFVGHSEGSLIGSVAGQTEKLDGFVSLCGPGRRLADIIREQLKPQFKGELAKKSEAILKALEAGKTVADVPKELRALYRPSVQPFVISLLKCDPAALVGKLTGQVLVVRGTADVQVKAADADLLAMSKKGVQTLTVENMTHVLKLVKDPKDTKEQKKTYSDPSLPIAPEMADGIAKFLAKALSGKK